MTTRLRALIVALYLPLGGCVCFTVGAATPMPRSNRSNCPRASSSPCTRRTFPARALARARRAGNRVRRHPLRG